ncbi:hypothetical protein O3G_MSEX001902 [Manduca sexta]|uniref:Reverse transcriptase domain-containing protein n=1 Tax=Manduca sexta TaxID=7130 RepID=A0A921YN15_MANSE|nr:hypothetical protein O3G_MSEX001902 [Manduca sexta]
MHFSSVYEINTHTKFVDENVSNTCDFVIDMKHIKSVVQKLNISKGVGPDNIPPLFIRKTVNNLLVPLKAIFNKSLTSGIFPNKWKEARIVPIFKNGKKDLVLNYRPISILSTFAKIFEVLVYPYVYNLVKNQISPHQHGFMLKRSTNSNLLNYIDDVALAVDAGYQVDAIYTDFSKAFDKVNHTLLLKKLNHFGVNGKMLGWCKSYLENRSSVVVIDGYKSKSFVASSCVPQGSNLGPLFSMFMSMILLSYLNILNITYLLTT